MQLCLCWLLVSISILVIILRKSENLDFCLLISYSQDLSGTPDCTAHDSCWKCTRRWSWGKLLHSPSPPGWLGVDFAAPGPGRATTKRVNQSTVHISNRERTHHRFGKHSGGGESAFSNLWPKTTNGSVSPGIKKQWQHVSPHRTIWSIKEILMCQGRFPRTDRSCGLICV